MQPTAGYVRLVTDQVLQVWRTLKADVLERATRIDRQLRAVQAKIDRLDEAFLYAQTIDLESYGRQRDKLRQEQTLARIEQHAEQLEELDVEGILGFAERVLPNAADLWVHASLDQKQRLQQLFFPDGIVFDGAQKRFTRTAATASFFR